ncbi:MAG: extracellular solute-binding protein [Butyrivibrio sp.]|nr:extracellular solute-binding protein [Butyrivibrio sp.]
MRRTISSLLAAILALLSLSACGETAEMSADLAASDNTTEITEEKTQEQPREEVEPQDVTTLRIAWWGTQTRHDRTIAALNLYEEFHPEIKFDYDFYTYEDYFTKLDELAASGEVWDIFQLGGNFPQYIDEIYPFDEFLSSGEVQFPGISEVNLKTTQTADGVQLGITNGINTYGIAYDPDMFEEAGAKLPTDDWTWDEYEEAADLISEKLGSFGSSTFRLSEFNAGCTTYIAQQGSLGQYSFYNSDYTGMGFEDPHMLTPYIKMRADMIKKGSYPNSYNARNVTSYENDFLVTGEAAMTFVAVNQFPALFDICKEQGRTLALTTIPRIKKDGNSGVQIQSSQMFCIAQDSENKKAAADFIEWFETSIDCNKILQAERGIPADDSVRASLAIGADEGQQIMYDFVGKVSSFPAPDDTNNLSPEGHEQLRENYREYIDLVAKEEMTADEAAEKIYSDALLLFDQG